MSQEASDRFFRDVCEHAGVAMIATDERLCIRFWNPAASRLLGGAGESMIGRPVTSIVPDERRELANRLCDRALTCGEISELDFQHRNFAGEPIFLAVTISPVTDQQGVRQGISVYLRDVTRRMTLERAMAHNQKMSALGSMAGQVAHHFNNVLGGIITTLDFAQTSDDPEQLRRALRTTVSALTRANSLTQGLLAFAEGDRGSCSVGDLAKIVAGYAAELEPRLTAQNIKLELRLDSFQAIMPARKIHTILDNLTINAREAMPDGGTLRIELQLFPEEPKVILRVSDTGEGIESSNLPRVFEPFFTTKVGNGSSHHSAHAGLGLAVVHGIVKEMGGSVTVGSAPRAGTVCSVILPLPSR